MNDTSSTPNGTAPALDAIAFARSLPMPFGSLWSRYEKQIPVAPIVDALTAQFSCRVGTMEEMRDYVQAAYVAASDPANLVPALALALSTLGK